MDCIILSSSAYASFNGENRKSTMSEKNGFYDLHLNNRFRFDSLEELTGLRTRVDGVRVPIFQGKSQAYSGSCGLTAGSRAIYFTPFLTASFAVAKSLNRWASNFSMSLAMRISPLPEVPQEPPESLSLN